MTAPCPFCECIAVGDYEHDEESNPDGNEDVVWFKPLSPVTPGHMLFVPTAHVESARQDPYVAGLAVEVASRWGAGHAEAFNLITSAGAVATQTVTHLHVHYVPRREGDGLHLPWTAQAVTS